jgi:hypothetical protein
VGGGGRWIRRTHLGVLNALQNSAGREIHSLIGMMVTLSAAVHAEPCFPGRGVVGTGTIKKARYPACSACSS